MKTKRSMWMALLCAAGAGLLVTNCTIKSDDDTDDGSTCTPGATRTGCECAGNTEGFQVCSSEGVYGGCQCPPTNEAGASNAGGGGASAGETSSAGEGGAIGTAGEGGSGGEATVTFDTCIDCLAVRCQTEYEACDADPQCVSTELDGSGQFERISACINKERIKGLVKRDVVRGCGVTIGVSADPDVISAWAPEGMADTTTNLLNCMADEPGSAAASWANDDANFPVDANDMINPVPWFEGTCAKDACTSAQ